MPISSHFFPCPAKVVAEVQQRYNSYYYHYASLCATKSCSHPTFKRARSSPRPKSRPEISDVSPCRSTKTSSAVCSHSLPSNNKMTTKAHKTSVITERVDRRDGKEINEINKKLKELDKKLKKIVTMEKTVSAKKRRQVGRSKPEQAVKAKKRRQRRTKHKKPTKASSRAEVATFTPPTSSYSAFTFPPFTYKPTTENPFLPSLGGFAYHHRETNQPLPYPSNQQQDWIDDEIDSEEMSL